MSWINNLSNDLIIITGDGKEFRPLWMPRSKNLEFNISEFDFPNVRGTLVKRTEARGRKFDLEVYFQGEDHLVNTRSFEISCNDKRAWNITHPYYGTIICQPTSITFDNTAYNVTKINTTVIETIVEDYPKITVAPQDKITNSFENTNEQASNTFSNEVIPNQSDITQLQSNNAKLYNKGVSIVDNEFTETYFNAFTKANAAITQATQKPLEAIRLLQSVITMPAKFIASVKARMDLLSNQFDTLRTTLTGITTKNQKGIYQNNAGSLINAMALTLGTPQGNDYQNSTDVLNFLQRILRNYNQYIDDLDLLQSDNGGSPDSFIPDINLQILLNQLINYTAANLYNIAINARQERSIFVEQDTNVILLAHRFYGLDVDDNNINLIINSNNIGLDEILNIRKGRKIVYYV